ncbi:MAG: type I glutamate--ammonia ligase, partial [Bacillota bacterium]
LEAAVMDNIYTMGAQQLDAKHIRSLPQSLEEALDELENSDLIAGTLTAHLVSRFIEAKRIEWDEYRSQVHQWEVDRYLGAY